LPENLLSCVHTPPYSVSDEERAELDEVLAEWERGEVADDAEVAEFFRTHGVTRT
jgi:hypothetical protein